MPDLKRIFILGAFVAGLLFCMAILYEIGLSVVQPRASLPTNAAYHNALWNDLGKHCYNPDFSDMAGLPPNDNLWIQVIQLGDFPRQVTPGIDVTYVFTDNNHLSEITNHWPYAQQLSISPTSTGHTDRAITIPNLYPRALITVKDSATQSILAQTIVVAPVSSELHCDNCHSGNGVATVKGASLQPVKWKRISTACIINIRWINTQGDTTVH